MLCVGYRDASSVKVGFPGPVDRVLLEAVIARLKRLDISKTRKTREKSRPFVHSYKIKGRVLVVSVYERLDARLAKEAIKAVFALVKTGAGRVTMAALDGIAKLYSPLVGERMPTAHMQEYRKDTKARLDQTQLQMDEVRHMMADNLQRTLGRGERMDDLEASTEALALNAGLFAGSAVKLERKQACRLCRLRCVLWTLLVVGCLFLVGGSVVGVLKLALPLLRSHD
jgi:Synaptobrevin